MKKEDIFGCPALEQYLLAKFQSALHSFDLAIGTSVAAALVSAVMVDLRRSDDSNRIDVICSLAEEAIVDLAVLLRFAIDLKGRAFSLPLGTTVQAHKPGSVKIGDEIWVVQAGTPGLIPFELARYDAHGPNLALLRETISMLVLGRPWQVIGLPSPVLISDCGPRDFVEFPPFPAAGGVRLRRWASDTDAVCFGAASPKQIKAFAQSIASDMEVMWNRREEMARQAQEVHRMALANLPADEVGVAVRAVSIILQQQQADEYFDFYVDYDTIDDALRPGVVSDYVPAPVGGVRLPTGVGIGVYGRSERRNALRAFGADGEIDSFAAAVVRHAPDGLAKTLANLALGYTATVTFMTHLGPVYAELFWQDGCIVVEIYAPGRIQKFGYFLEWYEGRVDDEEAKALKGRELLDVLPLPFDVKCTIIDAASLVRGVRLRISSERLLVNCATGRIWER